MIISYKPGQKRSSIPMIRIANHKLSQASGLNVGDEVSVTYLPGKIIITKINNHKMYVHQKIEQVSDEE